MTRGFPPPSDANHEPPTQPTTHSPSVRSSKAQQRADNLYQHLLNLTQHRDPRLQYRWVLSPTHIQALVDNENERRRKERERLATIPTRLPGFDPSEYIELNAPLPQPDYAKAEEMRLLGWPVRVDDVDENTLEEHPVRNPGRNLRI